MLNNFK